jgi:glycosyltransferase involved in cell wall biosynthesis
MTTLRVAIPLINLSWHGGVRVVVQLANFLADRGHDVSLVVSRNRVSSTFPVSSRVRLQHAGIHTRWKNLDYLVFLLVLPFVLPSRAILIANFFVTYYPVRLAAFLRRTRYFYFVQDIEAKYAGARGAILNFACRLTYADEHIIAANVYLKERLRNEYGRPCKHIAIGPGEAFYARPIARDKKYDLIYFLRGEPWKGLDRFTRILEALPETVTCLCVSQDERLLRPDSSRVHYRKPAGDDELIDCIDAARLLLFTSYVEGFALPPLEAMARGVPPVLFRCGGPDL